MKNVHFVSFFTFVILLIFIGKPFVFFAQELNKTRQLEYRLKNADNDSIRFITCIDLHNLYFQKDPEKSKQYADEMLAIASKNNRPYYFYKSYLSLARCARKKRDYKKVLHYDKLQLKTMQQSGDVKTLYSIYRITGNDYMDAGQPYMALPYINQCIHIAKNSGDDTLQATAEYSIANYYNSIYKYRQAIDHYKKSLSIYERTGLTYEIARNKTALAVAMMEVQNSPEIVRHLTDALETYNKTGSIINQAFCREVLASYYFRIDKIEYTLDNYKIARELYQKSNNVVEYAIAGNLLSQMLLKKKQTALVNNYLDESEKIFDAAGYQPGINRTMILWGAYYSQTGKGKKAEQYFNAAWKRVQNKEDIDEKISLEQYIASHYERQGKIRAKDSMLYLYYKDKLNTRDPENIINELRWKKRNKEATAFDSFMYTALRQNGGYQQVKTYFNNTFKGKLPDTSLLSNISGVNPDSLTADSLNDFGEAIDRLEAKQNRHYFKNKSSDLEIQSRERQHSLRSATIFAIAVTIALILSVLLTRTLFRRWKRTEGEKEDVKTEKEVAVAERSRTKKENEIMKQFQLQHFHLLQNNLRFFDHFLEHAKNEPVPSDSFELLQGKLISITKLYELIQVDTSLNNEINLDSFISEIWDTLGISLGIIEEVKIRIEAKIIMKSKLVVLLGYILTELITNTSKYAFLSQKDKQITIIVKTSENGKVHLCYRDNGTGIPETFHPGQGTSLIRMFCLDLNGNYTYTNDEGTRFDLIFDPANTSYDHE